MYLKNILQFAFVDIYLFNPFVMKNRKNKKWQKGKNKNLFREKRKPF
jgi:hypothetical protein